MFNSLRARLWLTYALIILVVVGIAGIFITVYLWRNPSEVRQETQRVRLVAALLFQRGEITRQLKRASPSERLQAVVERADRALAVRVVIQDSAGNTLADSRRSALPTWPVFDSAQAEGRWIEPAAGRDGRGRVWIYATRALADGQRLIVAVPNPRSQWRAILREEIFTPFWRTIVLALILSLLLAFWFSHWVSAPLQHMALTAQSISGQEPGADFQPMPLQGPAEVQILARALNEMAARVKASQQAQRDFVANVSHELKTPLTSIQGFAQAILDGAVDSPQALHGAADVIYSEAGRMHRMVLDLLDLARMDAGLASFDCRPLDLGVLLQGVSQRFSPQFLQNQVILEMQTGVLPLVLGDGDRLSQVFINLLDNALKYTPPGGQITLQAEQTGDWITVRLSDTGPGIPDGELERVFERFYQTDKSRPGGAHKGTGLGLAIAREIVIFHGGTILAQNSSGQGATFVVKIPVLHSER